MLVKNHAAAASEDRQSTDFSTSGGCGFYMRNHSTKATRERTSLDRLATWQRYAIAITAVIAAFLIRYSLSDYVRDQFPFLLFTVAAVITAYLAGFGPGLFALTAGGLLAWYIFAFGAAGPFHIVLERETVLLVYLSVTLMAVTLCEALHSARIRADMARREAEESAAKLRASERQLEQRTRIQEAIASLSNVALFDPALSSLLDRAVSVVSNALDVQFANILELQMDGRSLLLKACVGWKKELVEHATVPADPSSQAGYTLHASKSRPSGKSLTYEPVMVEDLRTETRFHGAPLLRDHGVRSGMSVVIGGNAQPFGVLGAYTTERRQFTEVEAAFLQTIANILSEALQHRAAKQALEQSKQSSPSIVRNESSCSIQPRRKCSASPPKNWRDSASIA
jgi:GAF domain-containing protein